MSTSHLELNVDLLGGDGLNNLNEYYNHSLKSPLCPPLYHQPKHHTQIFHID